MIGWNPPNLTINATNVSEAVHKQWPAQFRTSHSASLEQHTCDYALTKFEYGCSQDNLSKFKHVHFMIFTIPVWLALMNMHNDKWQIMYQDWYIWQMTKMLNGKLCVQLTHTKKGCKWNDMPIHTHYQNITCSALLSWLMVSNYNKVYLACIFLNSYIASYNAYAYTPQKFLSKCGQSTHKDRKSKTRGICERRNKHTKHDRKKWRNIHYKDHRE